MNCASRSASTFLYPAARIMKLRMVFTRTREQRTLANQSFHCLVRFCVFCYFQTRRGQRSGRVLVATDVRHSRGTRVSKWQQNNELVETEVCSSFKSAVCDRGRADGLVLATLCARLFHVNRTTRYVQRDTSVMQKIWSLNLNALRNLSKWDVVSFFCFVTSILQYRITD